jgi:hypothetical protein
VPIFLRDAWFGNVTELALDLNGWMLDGKTVIEFCTPRLVSDEYGVIIKGSRKMPPICIARIPRQEHALWVLVSTEAQIRLPASS